MDINKNHDCKVDCSKEIPCDYQQGLALQLQDNDIEISFPKNLQMFQEVDLA